MPDVIESIDAAGGASTTYTLAIGQTAQGSISTLGDHDWFRVDLVAGQTYTFALVGTGIFPPWITFSIIVLLAFIQLVLQLTTFMHLDRRSQLPIVFMTAGIGFSVIIAVAMFLMRN